MYDPAIEQAICDAYDAAVDFYLDQLRKGVPGRELEDDLEGDQDQLVALSEAATIFEREHAGISELPDNFDWE